MSLVIKTVLMLLILTSSACDSAKSTTSKEMEDQEKNASSNEKELVEQGYQAAVLIFRQNNGCPIIMEIQDTKEKLDPINMDEEKYSGFKREGNTVYVKIRRLRMMNRCPDASPVEITDIKQK